MKYVNYEVKGQVGLITINRPEALNALNSDVINELSETFDQVDIGAIRCIVITGSGSKSFVAGADIGQMCNTNVQDFIAFTQLGNLTFRKIETFPIPVIAAINGFALGGGCELSMACDIRLAAENAVFGQPEAGLGITPGFGGTQRLARLIGLGKAKELIYTCRNVKAAEALSLGLVQAVYPQDQLMDEAMKMAEKIASNAPIAIRACKEAINEGYQTDMDRAIRLEINIAGKCIGVDQKNAMTAFLEKRPHDPFINK